MVVETQEQATVSGTTADDILLSIRNLRVWYTLRKWGFGFAGYVRAVDGVNLEVRRGEAIAIVGESGCGKSTLMRTILGLTKITEGEVIFEGRRLNDLRGDAMLCEYRADVGYVQQDPFGALPPFMSVERIVGEPLAVAGVPKEQRHNRVVRALEEVKLVPVEDYLPKFPYMLSGGQQQRVVIARAMVMEPKLIVADEPVSMLDASVRVEILKLLERLQHQHNLSVIYVTHDLSTVGYFSQRVVVMYAGKIVEKAPVRELVRNPLHPYTVALLHATPDPDAENARKFRDVPPGEPPSLVDPPSGCRFHPRCAKMIEGRCDVEVPPEIEVEPGHMVACWLYGEA